jgi:hypothetical protein
MRPYLLGWGWKVVVKCNEKGEFILFLIMSFPQMWKHEGFFALYKGFWPNWLRLGPWNIIVSF